MLYPSFGRRKLLLNFQEAFNCTFLLLGVVTNRLKCSNPAANAPELKVARSNANVLKGTSVHLTSGVGSDPNEGAWHLVRMTGLLSELPLKVI